MNKHFLTVAMLLVLSLTGIHSKTSINPPEINKTITAVRTIILNANDQMKFDKTEIRVKAGEKIKLTLNHTGKLPKNAMGHNFVLLAKGTDIPKFAMAAMDSKATQYIPAKGVLAHTKLIGGGESTTIEFTVPAKGIYDFICSFPGHYALMKGKFIVE